MMGGMGKAEKGFTLLEMIIAQTFLAIGLLATITTIIYVIKNGSVIRNTTAACNLCEITMEMLKSVGYEGVANNQQMHIDQNGNPGGRFNRTVTVKNESTPDIKIVTVRVWWTESNKMRNTQLRTIIPRL
ncbi:MAG: type IV pilus modification PilV family protein [bacterium]